MTEFSSHHLHHAHHHHHPAHAKMGATTKATLHAMHVGHMRLSVTQEMEMLLPEDATEIDLFFSVEAPLELEDLEEKARPLKENDSLDARALKKQKAADARRVKEMLNNSERYQRQNYELQARLLVLLRESIKESDTVEEILAKVLKCYKDLSLADEALDFLLETTSGELRNKVLAAKKELNDLHGVDIRAGRNMGAQARQFSEQELGSPTALRDMYRDFIGNPREAPQLFEELSKEFSYTKMKAVIDFLLQSTGADLKSKGPSISRAELHRLMSETRSMQAILGIYHFFKSRMKLISSGFQRHGLKMSEKITFELIARMFMKFLQERYPSAEKVLLLANELDISDSTLAEIIIYTQMRDGVRQVAPKLYKSDQHKQDVLNALIGALEQLERELDAEEFGEEE